MATHAKNGLAPRLCREEMEEPLTIAQKNWKLVKRHHPREPRGSGAQCPEKEMVLKQPNKHCGHIGHSTVLVRRGSGWPLTCSLAYVTWLILLGTTEGPSRTGDICGSQASASREKLGLRRPDPGE